MTGTTYRPALPIIVGDRELPDGCDTWGIRSVRADLRSSRGFRWPWPGQWAEAAGQPSVFDSTNGPAAEGDGICVADTYRGMASGGIPARTLLLVAYASSDVLGTTLGDGKHRLRRAFVVDVVDGERVARENLSGANLSGANLSRAYLYRADLSGANLSDANLSGADLSGANLTGAFLTGADLTGADLSGADLSGADLSRANLTGANLTGAYLSRANLSRAYLSRANLTGADLSGAFLSGAFLSGAVPASPVFRRDGFEFRLWGTNLGWRISAGCRFFSFEEAESHWRDTRGGTPLGEETFAILAYFREMVRLYGKES
jgi:hypothetical protein